MKKNIPEELLKDREMIECNFIFCLYKDPELISQYKNVKNGQDIITEDGQFYYGIAIQMEQSGYNTFDNMSIAQYLENKEVLKEGFDRRGGATTINEIMSLLSIDNVEAYYQSLVKSNVLIYLYQAGFGVLDEFEKLQQMNADEICDYYEYKLADISVGKINKLEASDLTKGYDSYIDEWDQGKSVGYKISSGILNYMLAGIHQDNLTLHLAGIGQGKTTTAILMYVLPAIESGQNVLILSNEQTENEFRQMILSAVLFNKVGYFKGMNRQKFTIGGFNDDQREHLKKAEEWLKNQEGKIAFLELQSYDVGSIKKIVTKYSKLDYGLCIVDTLKQIDDSAERAYGAFSEMAKSLFEISKQTHTAIVCTAQLATDSLSRKYLDLSSVGKSRAISETATAVIGFRPIYSDEYDKIKPYKWDKNEDGKRIKIEKKLDPNEHYIIWFIMKNRWGNVQPQVVMKFNQNLLLLEDIGYYDAPFDNFRR